ncbi:hypothetical protein [Paludisphaera soli]|uniref:hypothetical protein n=1 Tax=Paludisphaera soli TaxID=2712865 RepID=UPI0013EDF609|nr:hypothetical protein [Paludisphaera soli]
MTGRRKWWWIVGLIVAASLALEVGVRMARGPRSGLIVVNGGDAPVKDLVASYAGVKVLVGEVAPGQSAQVRLENAPSDVVTLAFSQEGNPATGLLLGGDELDQARREGLRIVVVVKPGQLSRYMEDDVSTDEPSPLLRLVRRVMERIRPEF